MNDKLRLMYKMLGERDIPGAIQAGDKLVEQAREQIASLKLQINLIDSVLAPHRQSLPKDGYSSSERSSKVRESVDLLIEGGAQVITPETVIRCLAEMDVKFAVKSPNAVVATILNNIPSLEKVGVGRYRTRATVSSDGGGAT